MNKNTQHGSDGYEAAPSRWVVYLIAGSALFAMLSLAIPALMGIPIAQAAFEIFQMVGCCVLALVGLVAVVMQLNRLMG